MAGVTFTAAGAEKIKRVVKKVLGTPEQRGGDRTPRQPVETRFWAMLTGCDVTGLRWNFVRVAPIVSGDLADFSIGKDNALGYQIVSQEPEEGYCREVNGSRGIPFMSVVEVTYAGRDAAGLPAYVFQYLTPVQDNTIPIHDHRDTYNGGFAFAVYHPGTSLPQQPWAI